MTLITRIGNALLSPAAVMVLTVIAALAGWTSAEAAPGLLLGAISVQEFTLAKQNYLTLVPARTDAAAYRTAFEFFSWLAQSGGAPDLQVKPFTNLTGSNTVIADAACKLYVILLKKSTTTTAFFKGSDSASASSSTAPEVSCRQTQVGVDQMFFPYGKAMANGFTVSSDTTADGSTGSSAGDGAAGCVVLGRP